MSEKGCRKKRLAAASVALTGVLALAGACNIAYALFSGHAMVSNKVDIAYEETSIKEDFQPPEKLVAGMDIPKNVKVSNDGTAECYARVFCEFTDSAATQFAALDYNEEAWERHGYWWYLKEPLGLGEQSPSLITKISIGNVGEQQLQDFEVMVVHESVQAKGPDGSILPMADAWATVNVDVAEAAL